MKYHKLNGYVTEKKFRLPREFQSEVELEQFRKELAKKHDFSLNSITFNHSWYTGEYIHTQEEIIEYFKEVDKEFKREIAKLHATH